MLTQNQISTTQNLPLEPPFFDFGVEDLAPKKQTVWRFKGSAQTLLRVTNKSNRAVSIQITGQSEVTDCYVEFNMPAGVVSRVELQLEPGQKVSVPVSVVLPPARLLGFRRQRFFFSVTTTLLTGFQQRRPVLGQVTRPPIFGPGLMLLLVAGVLAGLFRLWAPAPQPGIDSQFGAAGPVAAEVPPSSFVMPVYQAGNSPQDPFNSTDGTRLTYQQMFQDIAQQYDLDWRLLAEIAYQESRFNPWAIGRSSEMGLMQIHPVTWSVWAPRVGVSDPYDPYSNVQVAAAFLAYLRNFCQVRGYSDPHWMLIGYNWGPNNLNELFQQQGRLDHVPERPRQYAITILQLESSTPVRRQAQLEALVIPAAVAAR